MKWLKYFREKQGYSQRVLSDKVGVQENTLWRWENGKSTPEVMSYLNRNDITKVLGGRWTSGYRNVNGKWIRYAKIGRAHV